MDGSFYTLSDVYLHTPIYLHTPVTYLSNLPNPYSLTVLEKVLSLIRIFLANEELCNFKNSR